MPRFTIAQVMALTGIVALNMVWARLFYDIDPEFIFGVVPMVIALHFGLYQSVRKRRRFWAGFVILGSLGLVSLIWGLVMPARLGGTIGGTTFADHPGSVFSRVWNSYFESIDRSFGHLITPKIFASPLIHLISALIISSPLLLLGSVGGLVSSLIFRKRRPSDDTAQRD